MIAGLATLLGSAGIAVVGAALATLFVSRGPARGARASRRQAQPPRSGSYSIRIVVRMPSGPSTAIVIGASIVWLSTTTRAG